MRQNEHLQQVVDYLKKNISKGYTIDSLRWALVNQGYSRIEISHAIDIAHQELAKEAPILKEKPIIKYEILDEDNKPVGVEVKKPFWKKLFGL